MKIKNKDLFALLQALSNVAHLQGVKFAYAVAKNIRILQREIQDLTKSLEPSKEYLRFDKKRIELCESMAEKDKDGKPLMTPDKTNYQIKDMKKFNKKLEELKKEFPEAMKEREKQVEEYNTLLEEYNHDIKLHYIKEEDLPQQITSAQILALDEIIVDEIKED